MASGASGKTIEVRLDAARRELLELGLRNPLLNFRLTARRGVGIVEPAPSFVFQSLVAEQKSLGFVPRQEEVDRLGSLPKEAARDGVRDSSPKELLTDVSSNELEKRLLGTYYDARTSIEETGVNILFVALGMLKWFEAESSEMPRYAPLLLIPVSIERQTAQHPFKVSWTGEEIGENLSLQMKLRTDFAVELPSLPDAEDVDVAAYLASVKRTVQGIQGWDVEAERTVLGFFSFAKFLMFKDLDATAWQDGLKPHEHAVIQALLGSGFEGESSMLNEDQHIDDVLNPMDSYLVREADSTQTLALMEALAGAHLVIQGPPGTGKSQTITNLIAEAVAAHKTVLFVSEKMAALEVVKRRLDEIGVGAACLELHSNKTNKKSVLDELKRTLELGKPKTKNAKPDLQQLTAQRDRLNAYCLAVNTPIRESGVSVIQAEGHLLRAQDELDSLGVTAPSLTADAMLAWDDSEYQRLETTVRELNARLSSIEGHRANPFWQSKRLSLLPSDKDRLRQLLSDALAIWDSVSGWVGQLQVCLGEDERLPAATRVRQGVRLTSLIATSPPLDGVPLESEAWTVSSRGIDKLVKTGQQHARLHQEYAAVLIPEAWGQDVLEARASLLQHRTHFWRELSGDYRKARRLISSMHKSEPPKDVDSLLAAAEAVLEEKHSLDTVMKLGDLGASAFGEAWRGLESDWEHLSAVRTWMAGLLQGVTEGGLPKNAVEYTVNARPIDRAVYGTLSASAEQALEAWLHRLSAVQQFLELEPESVEALLSASIEMHRGMLEACLGRADELDGLITFNIALEECKKTEGLLPTVEAARSWSDAPSSLLHAFRRSYFQALLDDAYAERPGIAAFDGSAHESCVEDFRRLDEAALVHNRARVLLAHWNGIPSHDGGGQVGVLRHEFQKKRRHRPLRKLMAEAGAAVQAIKPVFMMSPLSVATYLPAASVEFDLVVFDEASQVKPVEAFGAIIRGKQTVVVGDSKQLPPSRFFDSGMDVDEEEATTATDIESILGLFEGQGARTRMLRWHYRSRHHSLIAVSNHEFYDHRLVVFPSPEDRGDGLGVVFHHLPDTAYERGGSATNPEEARIVAEAVLHHAIEHPNKTLGVAAFSRKQADAIQDQLELLRRSNPSTEQFFAGHPHEPFFVKNLENVQGDERDVIFISVGYGRTAEGYLAMQFGPLSSDGGWRRLNVLITRARERCDVFSNITADDLDLNRTNARGVQALQAYLKYAQTGILDVPRPTAEEGDSPFEDEVARRLRQQGFIVDQQVGSGGFFIDLAVRDPERPGRYLLGVECDGATYHSSRSARDRDRLRQNVLEGLGWRIHRIWSTDWFRNPEQQLRNLAEAIEMAKVTPRLVEPVRPKDSLLVEDVPERDSTAARSTDTSISIPYTKASIRMRRRDSADFVAQTNQQLLDPLLSVLRDEGPIHTELAYRRLVNAAGLQRVGSRISERLDRLVRNTVEVGTVHKRGDFLWLPESVGKQQAVRDRSLLDPSEKKLSFVPPEELSEAMRQVVRRALGMQQEDVVLESARVLGFSRVGHDMRQHIERHVKKLLSSGELVERGGCLFVEDTESGTAA